MTRQARSLDEVKLPPWRFVLFADLHVSGPTLDRCLASLQAVREEALRRRARVVFLGDFWEARGVLNVRQVDALLNEFHRWADARLEAVFIPGNHDQVTVNGQVHGVRIFEPFHNLHVATDRILWPERKLAFIPWREEPAEQAAMFDLPDDGWTGFAHAEVQGASTNYGHVAAGRVSRAQIEQHMDALYLGHYHKRQQIGDRIWYVGNPYQKNIGERGDPEKGIAYIEEGCGPEPEWISLPHQPKYHRIPYEGPGVLHDYIREQDIVELQVPISLIGSNEVAEYKSSIRAGTVKEMPIEGEEDEDAPPAFALTLDQSVNVYVDERADAEGGEEVVPGIDNELLKQLGHQILSELPEARTINPLSPTVTLKWVEVEDFCAVAGKVRLDLDNQGLVLMKGPIGVGKTAIVDAVTWCFYGQTSPRKAGANGSTFRGDEVINDRAKKCTVEVGVGLADGREVVVRRSKGKKKSADVEIEGIEAPDGIADGQDLIDRVVGMPYSLWRTCVSLGQGAVGNFVTDADKARKGTLSSAASLDVCVPAQKLAKEKASPMRAQADRFQSEAYGEQRALEALQGTDYQESIDQFEGQREAAMQAAATAMQEATAAIQECDSKLQDEATWLQRKAQYEEHQQKLVQDLSSFTPASKLSELERQYGAAEAEKSMLEQQLAKARHDHAELEKRYEGNPSMPCPTCGQPMPGVNAEKYVAEKGHEIERISRGIGSLTTRMDNIKAQMDTLQKGGTSQREAIENQLSECRKQLDSIGQVVSAFARLRHNRERSQDHYNQANRAWEEHAKAVNPWVARQQALQGKIEALQGKIEDLTTKASGLETQAAALEFWQQAFGPKGLPVLVLRTLIADLEAHANRFMSQLLGGRVFCRLEMAGDDLLIRFFEQKYGEVFERRYEQLSGGQRRCVELAFCPFALSEMVFARCGVRVPFIIIDELTTHLGQDEKPMVCEMLRALPRDTIVVIDHDMAVQSEFDVVYEVTADPQWNTSVRRAA
jgi:ABC-type dipeptide/oligopeptide/nickel transport system ATPase subunit